MFPPRDSDVGVRRGSSRPTCRNLLENVVPGDIRPSLEEQQKVVAGGAELFVTSSSAQRRQRSTSVSFRRTLVLGTASVVGACTLFLGASPALAATPPTNPSPQHSDALRALAAQDGLRIGTAVNPSELGSSSYEQLIADQFSSVTPENEMRWEPLEPVRGQYNWAPADRLVDFAKANHQL